LSYPSAMIPGVHPAHLREEALRLHAAGVPFREIYRGLGLPRNTVGCWLYSRPGRTPTRSTSGVHSAISLLAGSTTRSPTRTCSGSTSATATCS